MPRLLDLSIVRATLERDRPWAAYALGDLSPGFVEHCEWFAPGDGSAALLLLCRLFDPPILFALGSADRLASLVREIDAPRVSLQVRPGAIAALEGCYETTTRAMLRMVVEPAAFRPATTPDCSRLSEADTGAIARLYADGQERGESPDFFYPSMVTQGIFWGAWEGDRLAAVAGTHLTAAATGVCAVGNVYTRRDRRGRGLAAAVTSAVVSEAFSQSLSTVVLNVKPNNLPAIRVYERLGFTRHCNFVEGQAVRL